MHWLWFQTFEDIDLFHLIGVICGLAIYNLTIVELHFPVALYKKLLKRNPTLDDLKELMPDVGRLVPTSKCSFVPQLSEPTINKSDHTVVCIVYFLNMLPSPLKIRSLQQLLDYPEDDVEDAFCLNFTVSV